MLGTVAANAALKKTLAIKVQYLQNTTCNYFMKEKNIIK